MAHYDNLKASDPQRVFNVIAAYPFALICKNSAEKGVPEIVSAPAILSADGGALEFHFARGNPAWAAFEAGGDVKMVFNGPSAHISPSWYKERFTNGDRSRTAPTWDYVQATVTGTLQPMDYPALTDHLRRLTARFEDAATGWQFRELELMTRDKWQSAIGGFTVRPASMEAIFKLSQEQKESDRLHVIDSLTARNGHGDLGVAQLIRAGLTKK